MAQRSLISVSNQLEYARALSDVVVRLGKATGRSVQRAAQSKVFTPRARHGPRVDACCDVFHACFGLSRAIRCKQGFAGNQLGLDRLGGRRRRRDFVGEPQRFVGGASARRQLRFEHANGPFVPQARLSAVTAVRLAGLSQIVARRFVSATHQRNLRERVEYGAPDLVELNLASDLQSAMQHFLGSLELAEAHENLSKRGERNGKAASRAQSAPAAPCFARRASSACS